MHILTLQAISLCILTVTSFPYTLPSDKNWPSSTEFIKLKNSITGNVIFRGDSGYKPHTWNRITNVPKPAAIIQPVNSEDIVLALKFARKYNIRVSVLSTGHHPDHRNIYDNSIHIDMSSMTFKSIDLIGKTLTLGSGNNFSQIHQYVASISNRTLMANSGADPGVGIYGWTSGGGHGELSRQFGLGVDTILSVELLLANLTVVKASDYENQELFRAIRGSGGGSYGIALSVTIKLFDIPGKISTFGGLFEMNNKTAIHFANWMTNAPKETVAYFKLYNLNSLDPFVTIDAYCFGSTSFCEPILSQLQDGCIPLAELQIDCKPIYERFQNFYELINGRTSQPGSVFYAAGTALNSANIELALKNVVTFVDNNKNIICTGSFVLGGVSSLLDLNQEKTSVAAEMRQSLVSLTCTEALDDLSTVLERKKQVNLIDDFAENVLKKHSKWVYWNEPQHNFPQNDWKERYWGGLANYNRLLAVKKIYDPENVFTCYHCVGYENFENEDPSFCPEDSCTCSNTPQGQCANIPNIESGTNVFSCNFDSSNNQTGCNGKFTYNLSGQQAGLFDSSNTVNTQLGYDVTDFTSIG